MNAQDEEDFVFACLLGAYIQSLRQQEGQQQFLQKTSFFSQPWSRRLDLYACTPKMMYF